jgi:uncharacterized membrane protein YozB (DUF420 family)
VFCKYAGANEKVKYGTLIRFAAVQNPSALVALLNQAKNVPGALDTFVRWTLTLWMQSFL